jgi:hypothetical protein
MPTIPNHHKLSRGIEAHDWVACAEGAFEAIFALPPHTGRRVAADAVARFASTFTHAHPTTTWPLELLRHPEQWFDAHGRHTLDVPPTSGIAAQGWLSCMDALLLGASTSEPTVRTAAWATATETAINSRAIAVWEVDDPESVELWLAGQPDPMRSYPQNAAARAVLEREWWWAATALAAASAQHGAARDESPEASAALERWRAAEHQLLIQE